jgi:DNA polymerase-3 subunit delta'
MRKHIGHRKIINLLKKQIFKKNIHHAYLFIGPTNVGKLNLAKYFATLIHSGKNDKMIKSQIDKDIHPDTIVIKPNLAKKTASRSISINQIHELLRRTSLSPHSSKWKVGIISDVETMTIEASNAFLKTLEEPGKTSIFILTTTNERLILPTIVSRCQKLYLGLVERSEILKDLKSNQLGIKRSQLVANLSAGKPGLAKRLSKKKNLEKYSSDIDMIEKIILADDIERLSLSKSLYQRRDLIKLLDIWLLYIRDLLAVRQGFLEIIINIDRIKKITDFSKKIPFGKIQQIILAVQKSQEMLESNANPRLVLENLVLEI